jgi:hypothetical protein
MYLREQQAIADAGSGLRDRLLDTVRGLLDQLPSS